MKSMPTAGKTSRGSRMLICISRVGNHKPSAAYRIRVTLDNVQTIDQRVNNNIVMRSVWLPCEMHDRWAQLFASYHLHGNSNLTPTITTKVRYLSLTTLTTTSVILWQEKYQQYFDKNEAGWIVGGQKKLTFVSKEFSLFQFNDTTSKTL